VQTEADHYLGIASGQFSSLTTALSILMAALAVLVQAARQPGSIEGAAELIRRSVEMNEADWQAEPAYDHCERDDDGHTARTYDVTMVEGTPYKRLIAVNDKPLPGSRAVEEQRALERVAARRRVEAPSQRRKRLAEFQQTQARIHTVLDELARAFTFSPAARRDIGGREAYVLSARARPGYRPPNRDTQALNGMNATFWIDPTTYQWIRVTALVTRPVSVVAFPVLRVEPGTTFEVEKAPVGPNLWLTSHLQIRSTSRILLFVSHHTFYDERDFDYRPGSTHASSMCRGSSSGAVARAAGL
jgi:hypothetical protein